MKCPKCGVFLFEDENLVHDGYMGNPHAHGGAGSYGLARHHYYFKCECGWSEKPEIDRAKKLEYRRKNFRRRVAESVPESGADYVEFRCRSKQTRIQRWINCATPLFFRGGVTDRSCGATYRYTRIDKNFYLAANFILKGIKNLPYWGAEKDLLLQKIIEQYWIIRI